MTMFGSQIGLKPLEGLCRRASISLGAGIDARTVWSREAQRAAGPLHRHLTDISDAINEGESLTDALADSGEFFPAIFREMCQVGEQTGHLDTVLAQLAEHYHAQLNMRRIFLGAIAWPMIQLVLALGVIGFLIWILGMIGDGKMDILGFGLVGNRGLAIYLTIVGAAAVVLWFVVHAVRRGLVWTRPIQRLVLQLPVIGTSLQTMALSRLAWSMHLTMNTGMDVRRALSLSLRSTQNARYIDQIPAIEAEIKANQSIRDAFVRAGGYPVEFLDTLAVGEDSGRVVESMGHLAVQYQDRARAAMAAMAVVAGWLVWALVAAFIIVLIFRIFSFYVGTINDLARPGAR